MPRTFIRPSSPGATKVSRKVALARKRATRRQKRSEVVSRLQQSPARQPGQANNIVIRVPNDSQTNEIAALFEPESGTHGRKPAGEKMVRLASAILATPPQEEQGTVIPPSPPPRPSTSKVRAKARQHNATTRQRRGLETKTRKSPEQLFERKRLPLPRGKLAKLKKRKMQLSEAQMRPSPPKRVVGQLTPAEVALIKAHRLQRCHASPTDSTPQHGDPFELRCEARVPNLSGTHTGLSPQRPLKRQRPAEVANHTSPPKPPQTSRVHSPRKRSKKLTPARRAIIDATRVHASDLAFRRPRKSRVEADFDHDFQTPKRSTPVELQNLEVDRAGEIYRNQPIVLNRKKRSSQTPERSKIIRVPSFLHDGEEPSEHVDSSLTELATENAIGHSSARTHQEQIGSEEPHMEPSWQGLSTQRDELTPSLASAPRHDQTGDGVISNGTDDKEEDAIRTQQQQAAPTSSQLEREVFDHGLKVYGQRRKPHLGWRRKVPVPPLPQTQSEDPIALASPVSSETGEENAAETHETSSAMGFSQETLRKLVDNDDEEEGEVCAPGVASQVLAGEEVTSGSETPAEEEFEQKVHSPQHPSNKSPDREVSTQDHVGQGSLADGERKHAKPNCDDRENSLSFVEPSDVESDGEPSSAVQELLHATLLRAVGPRVVDLDPDAKVCIPSSQSQSRRNQIEKRKAVETLRVERNRLHQSPNQIHTESQQSSQSARRWVRAHPHSEMVEPTLEEQEEQIGTSPSSLDTSRPVFHGLSFMITSIVDRLQLERLIVANGGRLLRLQQIVATNTLCLGRSRCVLISDSPRQSCKFLLALALGLPRVRPSWLQACLDCGHTNVPIAPHAVPASDGTLIAEPKLSQMQHYIRGSAGLPGKKHECGKRMLAGKTALVFGDAQFVSELECIMHAAGASLIRTLAEPHDSKTIVVIQPRYMTRLTLSYTFPNAQKQRLLEQARDLTTTAEKESLRVVSLRDIVQWLVAHAN